jgi:hypothetical protein
MKNPTEIRIQAIPSKSVPKRRIVLLPSLDKR